MLSPDQRVCFVGDSFVQGTMDEACLGWAGRVCAAARGAGFELTGYNLGVRRDTSDDVRRRWLTECEARLPEGLEAAGVVFAFGTNDTTEEAGHRRVTADDSVANLRDILAVAAGRGWRTCFIGPPPVDDAAQNERIDSLSDRLVREAKQEGVPALSVFEALAADEIWMREAASNDGAHPSGAGYERLAQLVLQWEDWWFQRT